MSRSPIKAGPASRGSDIGGYTLVEVIIALAILGLVLGAVFEVFSTGLRNASNADAYITATVLAQSRLARLSADKELAEGEMVGNLEGGFIWRAIVTPYLDGRVGHETPPGVAPLLLTLTVSWGVAANKREVTLVTLQLATSP